VSFTVKENFLPVKLDAVFVVSYYVDNQPCTKTILFDLPLSFFCKPIQPIKRGSEVIILNMRGEHDFPVLSEIFEKEFRELGGLYPDAFAKKNILTFQFRNYDSYVTIQTKLKKSKGQENNSSFLCLRSDKLASLTVFLNEIIHRDGTRQSYCWEQNSPELRVQEQIKEYWEMREGYDETEKKLEEYAVQLRSCQKRILIKLKDKISTPLTNLEVLLRDTHESLIRTARERQSLKGKLTAAENVMHSIINLFVHYIGLAFNVDELNQHAIKLYIGDCSNPEAEQSWASKADAHIFHLLRTTLAKTTKDKARTQPSIENCNKVEKLQKHVRALRERLRSQKISPMDVQGEAARAIRLDSTRNSAVDQDALKETTNAARGSALEQATIKTSANSARGSGAVV